MSRFSMDSTPVPVTFVARNGTRRALAAPPATNLMRLAKMEGVDMYARCGGNLKCATCFVNVSDDWAQHLPPPSEAERRTLGNVLKKHPNARLACQLFLNPRMAGLEMTVMVGNPRIVDGDAGPDEQASMSSVVAPNVNDASR